MHRYMILPLLTLLALTGCAPAAPEQIQSFTTEPGKEWRKQVRLFRQRDMHHHAEVMVNGKPVHFLVDTGATTIALTGDDARALGFQWTKGELEPVGRAADSSIVIGKRVTLDHVKLGHIEAWDMRAAILPGMEGRSLLGQNFMSHAQSIELKNDEMILR